MQAIELSESQQDFARCIGYEVALKGCEKRGVNLGLAFSKQLANDGIIKASGVNVFYPTANYILETGFDELELIFPEAKPREFRSPIADALVYAIPNTKHTSCCLDKAKDDEPIFVLLARDLCSDVGVVKWVAESLSTQPFEKLMSALEVVGQMQKWRKGNGTK